MKTNAELENFAAGLGTGEVDAEVLGCFVVYLRMKPDKKREEVHPAERERWRRWL